MALSESLNGSSLPFFIIFIEEMFMVFFCSPIPPGGSFTYEVPIENQWGTYWWHSHYKVWRDGFDFIFVQV
jgi:FtsP/CotA-like multicopper oxidase with cupredoxin domain